MSSERNFLLGGGELGVLIAEHDWSKTELGPLDDWPRSLRTAVSLIIRSPVPIVLLWGENGIMIYNDGYAAFAGGRHPQSLGCQVRLGWPEVADFNDRIIKAVLSGETLSLRDQELELARSGKLEATFMNLNYSPAPGEDGNPAGVVAIVVETTARVRAERWLQGEQERLRQMFAQAPGFMAMLSGENHVFDLANLAFLQLVGHRDVIGKCVREALPELEGQLYFERLDEVFSKNQTFYGEGLEVQLQRQSGAEAETRFVDLVYQPIRGEAGEVIGIFVQGSDVTDRVLAERALRAREAEFRTFAQVMPNHVWASTADGRLDWFNDQVYVYSGLAHGALNNIGLSAVIHPEDLADADRRWSEALATSSVFETQFRIRRADGAFRWHLVRAQPIRSGRGEIVRWVGTNTDIEDHKAASETLSSLNVRLENQVVETIEDRDRIWRLATEVMAIVDFDGRILSINPAWTTLLGWREAELMGRLFLDQIHPDDQTQSLGVFERLVQGTGTIRFDTRYAGKDGAYRHISWAAVSDEERIHAVGRDVTAERAAEEALRRTAAALEQSQKMETMGKLTGGVAHDFNNLLQVISGNLHLVAKDVAGNERLERRVANALAGVSRGAKLAGHLLAFGRRQPLEPKVLNMARLVRGVEELLRRSLGDAVEVETVVSASLWNTLADPAQVENVLLNLAINARDAMEGVGKLTIELGNARLDDVYVETHPEVTAGQFVMLAVTDTGCGMSPEAAAQAFEPFFTTKAEGRGTGLGLSMVYGFVKQSGGHIKIYSEVGIGTTVRLYLPRALQAEDVLTAVSNAPVVGGSETILVAEDDEEVRDAVVETLTDLGYRVLKAKDAQSALTVLESGAPVDLLFTDVVMPGPLRSPDLARQAKERLPKIAVLFTSGYTDNAIVHGGRLDPGVELLSKPYSRENLARKVRQVLSDQAQRNQIASRAAEPNDGPAASRKGDRSPSLTVLLIEDDAVILKNTAEMLQNLGHVVVEAASAEEATMALQTAPIDVLVTDIVLPGLSGAEFARTARALRPMIGLIFATASHQAPRENDLADAAFLPKPYDQAGLSAALETVCELFRESDEEDA